MHLENHAFTICIWAQCWQLYPYAFGKYSIYPYAFGEYRIDSMHLGIYHMHLGLDVISVTICILTGPYAYVLAKSIRMQTS
jgi:hypothetical protein